MKSIKTSKRDLDHLYSAILQLKTIGECQKFFRDLCTLNELSSMTERWQVAQLLQQGMPYREICKRTGSSTTTITRVAQWLEHGEGGYKLALKRLKH